MLINIKKNIRHYSEKYSYVWSGSVKVERDGQKENRDGGNGCTEICFENTMGRSTKYY